MAGPGLVKGVRRGGVGVARRLRASVPPFTGHVRNPHSLMLSIGPFRH